MNDASSDATVDAGLPTVAQISIPDLSPTPLDVVAYDVGMSLIVNAGGGGTGVSKPSISQLSVTLRPTPTSVLLENRVLTGAPLGVVKLTAIDPNAGPSPFVLQWNNAVVTSESESAAGTFLQSFTFSAQSLALTTGAATATYDVSLNLATCNPQACAAKRGPYVAAQPGWSIEPGATRVDALDDGLSNGGKAQLTPITVATALEPTLACAACALLEGMALSTTTFAVASPLSASLGPLETETLQVCKPTFVTGVSISGGASGITEQLAFETAAFTVTDRAFDTSGNVTSQSSTGWSLATNSSIVTCP